MESFRFDSVHLSPKEQIGLHRQESWELSYIIKGSGTRLVGEKSEPFSSGEVVLIPPEIPHCWYFDGEDVDTRGRIANITVVFEDSFLEKCREAFPELSSTIGNITAIKDARMLGREKSQKVGRILEAMRDQDDAARVVSFLGVLLELSRGGTDRVVGTRTTQTREAKRLSDIQIYVICNSHREITLEEIARYSGMNKSAFCTFFKKATGMTFVEYLNSYRVKMACQMLQRPGTGISDACYQAGFGSVPYFCRVFRQATGMPPGQWKKRMSSQKVSVDKEF